LIVDLSSNTIAVDCPPPIICPLEWYFETAIDEGSNLLLLVYFYSYLRSLKNSEDFSVALSP